MGSNIQGKRKWETLIHNGVAFPPAYQHQGIRIKIDGEDFLLNSDQEELVIAWARKKDTHYVKDPVFQSNFLSDLVKLFPQRFHNKDITSFDFSNAFDFVEKEKREKEREKEHIKNLSKDEKKRISLEKKEQREKLKSIYGKAIVDGTEVEVANWLVEPPGLFMGRGQHPLRGRWKPRVTPKDVTLNLGETSPVPEGAWANIVHDHTSTWLATWMENLTGKRKYVWLHDSASLRQNNDREKYDKALKLEKYIDKVQKEIIKKMSSKDINQRKIATVCYLIFKLAMRVGDEKDPEETDTVGASTLRVEHIKFPSIEGKIFIEFNFLGKDSVPWQKHLEIDSPESKVLSSNMQYFMKGKDKGQQIFDGITSTKVNSFLRKIDPKNVPGLTAKVFRTYIATTVVKKSLLNPPIRVTKDSSESKKLYVAKIANLKAAITCNHKKGIDPNNPASKKMNEKFDEAISKREDMIKKIKYEIKSGNYKTERQKQKLEERMEKISMLIKLQKETRDYNLGTSLRNYIDPRVMKAWMDYMELDWSKMYTSTLQRKFKWVEGYSKNELKKLFPIVKQMSPEIAVVKNESRH